MNLPNHDQTGPDQAGPDLSDQADLLQLGPAGADGRLVLLHGWGADAHDLLDLGEMLVGPELSVVALQAPEPHPLGVGRQWYGLQPIDWGQLPAARAALRQRLEQLASSVPLGRTVVLGFSQGGAMALDVASGLPVAGIVACSGYPHEGWQPRASEELPLPPVLLSHGQQDPVVPFAASEEARQRLLNGGGSAKLLAFEGGHTIDPALLPNIANFVATCLG